jgi:hypothetical protein
MGYIVGNLDKKQYLRPEAFGENDSLVDLVDSYEGVMCALVVLLADSNNRGGGDLRSDHSCIGSWAGDRIIVIDETVCLPEFSEPGMADVPLQKQLLTLGTDVSRDAIDAILDGEGGYSRLSHLNPRHVLPLVQQAKLQDAGAGAILTAAGRIKPLAYLEDLFTVLNKSMPLATKPRERALEAGINGMAEMLGRPERYSVSGYSARRGKKMVPSQQMYARQEDQVEYLGDKQVTFEVTDAAGKSQHVVVNFGLSKGTTVGELYESLFPGIEFERPETAPTRSPEVAKLLSFLDKSMNGVH